MSGAAFLLVGVLALGPVGLAVLVRMLAAAAAAGRAGGFCVVSEVVSQDSGARHDCGFCAHGRRRACSVGEMVSTIVVGTGATLHGAHGWVTFLHNLSVGVSNAPGKCSGL